MGVSGVGKSLIGASLADRLDMPFADADSLHSYANLVKMSAGIPLDDSDRWPWLDDVGRRLATRPSPIVACSALRRAYRDRIREHSPETVFVLLTVGVEVLRERVGKRVGHFMPPSLLASQLRTLEPLDADEIGCAVDASATPEVIVAQVASELRTLGAAPA